MNPVEIRNLTKRYPGFSLDNVTLDIAAGFVTGFVGANGSGKTTTIKCALGLLHADAGTVSIVSKERIGVVFDTPPYNGDWYVKDVEKAMARFYPRWDHSVFAEHLDRGGVVATKKIKELSRGMGMRLQMAVALAHAPQLLILDELTSGLDPLARSELREILADFMTDERNAVWYSTHITTDLERLADNLVVLDHGRVMARGVADDVLADFRVVRGRPEDLTPEVRDLGLGLKETRTGWEALVHADQLERLPATVVMEDPSIEDLAVAIAKGGRHE